MIGNINTEGQGTSDEELALLEDSDLLRRYADDGSQAAFAELVRRRIGLVYAVALRQTRGDRHRAEDATQAVFTDLARKAASLARRSVLVGWLHRSAQFAAAGLIRAEQRRHAREQEAHTMEKIFAGDAPVLDWEKLRPLLDEALNEMDERDRDAILLRFFDGRPFAEIGGRLRLTEGAARMRVERALAKLHAALARRGVTSTAAALGVALGQQVGAAAPAGLAATVTGGALAASAAGAGGWLATFMGMTKLQAMVVGGIIVAGTVGFISQATTNADLRRDIATQRESQQTVATRREENRQLASAAAEVEALRRDAEYQRLAQRVAEAKKANAETARLSRQRAATGQNQSGSTQGMAASSPRTIPSISLKDANLESVFDLYERLSRSKIIRDPSLKGIYGPVNFQGAKMSTDEAMRALQTALRDQANVVLESGADGTVVAKRGPPR
jgi:RNA polymerase sigma factor (sigma-70 family)